MPGRPRRCGGPGIFSMRSPLTNQTGFSLIEALTATVIAVLAVLGLAYTFGVGSGQVNRYAVARAALGAAESRMERLLLLADAEPGSDSLEFGYVSATTPFVYNGDAVGSLWWHVDGYNDPDLPANPDMHRLVVCVRWNTSVPDSVEFSQLLPLP